MKYLLYISIIGLISCQPWYFKPDDYETMLKTEYRGDAEIFEYKLRPYNYFKNNRLTTALFSDSSYFVNRFFNYDGQAGDFYIQKTKTNKKIGIEEEVIVATDHTYMDDMLYTMSAYTYYSPENASITNTPIVFIANQNLKSANGAYSKSKMSKLFYGRVVNEKKDQKDQKIRYVAFIDSIKNYECIDNWLKCLCRFDHAKFGYVLKKTGLNEVHRNPLAIIFEQGDNELKIDAIVDVNYTRKYPTSVIFDLNQIFNEEIRLIKKTSPTATSSIETANSKSAPCWSKGADSTWVLNPDTTYKAKGAFEKNKGAFQINTVQQPKGEWAKASIIYDGESGIFPISLTSMQETDGECFYRILIDEKPIFEFQNPRIFETNIAEYASFTVGKKGIFLSTGAKISVEFKSHSNSLVKEGDGFGWARGRWKNLSIGLCDSLKIDKWID